MSQQDLDSEVPQADAKAAEPKPTPVSAEPKRAAIKPIKKEPARPRETPVTSLIAALTGGKGLTEQEQNLYNSVALAFGLRDDDPLWLVVLPSLLRRDNIAEIRELFAIAMKSKTGTDNSDQLLAIAEALQEERAAINLMTSKLDKAVERALINAAAQLDITGAGKGGSAIDSAALAKGISTEVSAQVSASVSRGLTPARWGVTAGVLATVAALAFLAGIFINKSGYEKYVAELEGRVAVYQQAMGAQKR